MIWHSIKTNYSSIEYNNKRSGRNDKISSQVFARKGMCVTDEVKHTNVHVISLKVTKNRNGKQMFVLDCKHINHLHEFKFWYNYAVYTKDMLKNGGFFVYVWLKILLSPFKDLQGTSTIFRLFMERK